MGVRDQVELGRCGIALELLHRPAAGNDGADGADGRMLQAPRDRPASDRHARRHLGRLQVGDLL